MNTLNAAQIEEIVSEVIKRYAKASADAPALPISKSLLVVGTQSDLPQALCENAALSFISQYEGPKQLEKHSGVLIASLSLAQLCDIALGRDTKGAACAVLNALLCGMPVQVLPAAFSHRSFLATAPAALYEMYEQYAQKLYALGVCDYEAPTTQNSPLPSGECKSSAAPAKRTVVTQAVAQKLVAQCKGECVTLERGSILTPSAKDVFYAAKKSYIIQS